MNRYTLYCTESQTKKALELGAPIHSVKNAFTSKDIPHFKIGNEKDWVLYIIPTAEQMLGYLEEQKGIDELHVYKNIHDIWVCEVWSIAQTEGRLEVVLTTDTTIAYYSRKEATLAAINAALEYLTNNKK